LGDTIGVVDVAADSLADATYVDPPLAGVANTTEGTVAIEQGGDPLHPSGPSRLVRLEMDTGASTKLVSTDGRITDLATDPTGSYLLWVEGGDLHWLAADVEATLPGDFVAAGWMNAA